MRYASVLPDTADARQCMVTEAKRLAPQVGMAILVIKRPKTGNLVLMRFREAQENPENHVLSACNADGSVIGVDAPITRCRGFLGS